MSASATQLPTASFDDLAAVKLFLENLDLMFATKNISNLARIDRIHAVPTNKLHHYFADTLFLAGSSNQTIKISPKKGMEEHFLAQHCQTIEMAGRVITKLMELIKLLNSNHPDGPLPVDESISAEISPLLGTISQNCSKWHAIANDVIRDTLALISQVRIQSSRYTFLFWHAFDDMQNCALHYQKIVATILRPGRNVAQKSKLEKRLTAYIKGLAQLGLEQRSLEYQDDVSFYAYRFKQLMQDKHRKISALPHDSSLRLKVTGFDDACKEYRKLFQRVFFEHTVNKTPAVKILGQLQELVSRGEIPEFAINPELPARYHDQMLSLLTDTIQYFVKPYPDSETKGSLVEFIHLCCSEKNLRDHLYFAKDLFEKAEETKTLQTVSSLTPATFTREFQNHAKPQPHAELVAREKGHLKMLEQEARQKREVERLAIAQLSITREFEAKNQQQIALQKKEIKEELLAKISALGSSKPQLLLDFLNVKKTHHQLKEKDYVALFTELGLLNTTASGYIIRLGEKCTSTHRSSDNSLDGNFVTEVRGIFADYDIQAEVLEQLIASKNFSA